MVKVGVRKPSFRKSLSARTKGRFTRSVKRAINPAYGRKGSGWAHPRRKLYSSVYSRSTVSYRSLFSSGSGRSPYRSSGRVTRSSGKLGCWGWMVLIALIALAIKYWWVILIVVLLLLGIYLLWLAHEKKQEEAAAPSGAIPPVPTLPQLATFKVAYSARAQLKAAVDYARAEHLFNPYHGLTDAEIADRPMVEYQEADLGSVDCALLLRTEPQNPDDPHAIAVFITMNDKEFKIGYVPKKLTGVVHDILRDVHDGNLKITAGGELTGGEYKVAEPVAAGSMQTQVVTHKRSYGFIVDIYEKQ